MHAISFVRHSALALALAAATLSSGAASAQATGTGGLVSTAEAPDHPHRPNRDLISEDEIRASTETDTFVLIYTLRPNWLRTRGQAYLNRTETIQVYVNGIRRFEGTAALRELQLHTVQSIRHLDGPRATERFGGDHGAGAILVTTR